MLRMKVWIRENSNGQLEIINIDGDCRKKLSLINVDGKTFLSFENNSYVIIEDGQDIYFDGIEEPWSVEKGENTKKHSIWAVVHPKLKKKILRMNHEYILAMTKKSAENGILHNTQRADSKFEHILQLYSDFIKFRIYYGGDVNRKYECNFYEKDNFKRETRCYSNGEEQECIEENGSIIKKINNATMVIHVSEQFENMYRLIISIYAKNKQELNENKSLIKDMLLDTKELKDVMGDDFDELIEEIKYTPFKL